MIQNLASGISQLLFPDICEGCGETLSRQEENICISCMEKFPYTRHEQAPENYMKHRFDGRVPVQYAASLLYFFPGSVTQKMMHAIKYKGAKNLAQWLGQHLGHKLKDKVDWSDKILVPVPIHPQKILLRGFNQSEEIARGISDKTGAFLETEFLERIVHKDSQTRKNRSERWEDIQHDFMAKSENISGKNIFLVDDVCTTGATLEICANVLLNSGASSVGFLTLAFASESFS